MVPAIKIEDIFKAETSLLKWLGCWNLSSCLPLMIDDPNGEQIMIYTLISLLLLFWFIGLIADIGGGFIHALLVLALAVFLINLLTGTRTPV